MSRLLAAVLVTVLFSCANNKEQKKPEQFNSRVPPEIVEWFKAWQLVSAELHLQDSIIPVDFVFFDDSLIYTTAYSPNANLQTIDGPSLTGTKTIWKSYPHLNQIILPDSSNVKPGIFSFAAPNKGRPYFVMPLLSFWKQNGVESKELGLSNLITGIFVHEFSHSQQMMGLGKLANDLEEKHEYDIEFTDNIIQDYYKGDSVYAKMFQNETNLFYSALLEKDSLQFIRKKDSAIAMMLQRHDHLLKKRGSHFLQLDKLFLTMEGLGQYLMYRWLIHPKGGNIDKEIALKGVRRGGKNWSQEEGLVLFLCIDRMKQSNDWIKQLLGSSNQYITTLFAVQHK